MATEPKHPAYIALNLEGLHLQRLGKTEAALAKFRESLAAKPDFCGAYNNMGNVLRELGDWVAAERAYHRCLVINPNHRMAHSNLLYLFSYNLLRSPKALLEEARCWDMSHGRVGRLDRVDGTSRQACTKRLRIGYVSADFYQHSVAHFLEPILANHDHHQFEIYCYTEVYYPDAITERLKSYVNVWRHTVGMTDAALAKTIYNDHIDVLVDLSGHTGGNRLAVFTYRPAPVQVTYLGYFATTGLAAMDYWITDLNLHPESTSEETSETIYRLPRCWVCYQPPAEAPELVRTLPNTQNITFGSFNNLAKINARVVAVWSRVLRRLPHSRLLLKARQLVDVNACDQLIQLFAQENIPRERLILIPRIRSIREHLQLYARVDIALDTFPCTGGSTSAEALWMGVPVVTLAGERFIERMSTSMLRSIGADSLVCDSEETFVQRAIQLAMNPAELLHWHATLRQRMQHADLCDGRHMAQALEDAFKIMLRNSKQPVSAQAIEAPFPSTKPPEPTLPFYPNMPPISLELTNHCNLSCPYCGNHNLTRSRGEISWSLLEKLVKECRNTHSIAWLHGNGEPLLYDRLEEAIALIKKHNAGEASFKTNGTLMTAKRAKSLLKAGLSSIFFSLDSLDPKIYQATRGAPVDKVIRNIKQFIKMAPGDFPVRIALMNSKVQTVQETQVALFQETFGKHPNVQLSIVENTVFPESSEDYCRPEGPYGDKKPTCCFLPRNFLTIVADGRVSLCYVDQDVKHVLGDINRQTPQEIWFDPRNQATFKNIATGRPDCPSVCVDHCILDHLKPNTASTQE